MEDAANLPTPEQHGASWHDLTTEQKNAVLALCLGKSVREAATIFRSITHRSKSYFYANIYPTVKPMWRELSDGLPDEALRVLRGGSLAAARELVSEVEHRDVRIRNKASNDILERVIPREPNIAISMNQQNNTFVSLTDFMQQMQKRKQEREGVKS
jgi:hypothetical protein